MTMLLLLSKILYAVHETTYMLVARKYSEWGQ